jgi:hypothetical protein
MYLMALGICAIVYRFLAYVVLKIVKERWVGRTWKKMGGGKKRKNTAQTSTIVSETVV